MPQTLFEKIWNSHVVMQEADCLAVLYIDLHVVLEVTTPQAFQAMREKKISVRQPSRTIGTLDHSVPTTDPSLPITDPIAAHQVRQMEINCKEFGIPLFGLKNP